MEIAEILQLSLDERLQLVDDIWDSIASDVDAFDLTPAQKAELDRRIDEYEADPSNTQSWEEVRNELPRA